MLKELYQNKPEAKEKTTNAASYWTFSNININLFLLSPGNGYGVVHNNATGNDTSMKMRMIGAGLGAGVKDFRAVIIFKNQDVFHKFVEESWELGYHADAAVKDDDSGTEVGFAGE